jgi:hypothetical protein
MLMIFASLMQRVLLGALAVVALTYMAFAQAGSTGGTLGNTDKSISGDREEPGHSSEKGQVKIKRPHASESASVVGPKVFVNPTINGVRVDHCLGNIVEGLAGTGCGEAAAAQWCRSKGMARAVSYHVELVAPTYRQGEHTICRTTCGAFTDVTCE